MLRAYARQFGIAKLEYVVPGGDCGQSSIRNELFELEKHFGPSDLVLVHDGNRPFVSEKIISDCIEVAREKGCAVPAIPCAEAMYLTEDQVTSNATISRDNLKRMQTPQGFMLGDLCAMHKKALEVGITNSIASGTLAIELGQTVR